VEQIGANPRLLGIAPVVLYRAIGDLLPKGLAEGAAVWALCQVSAQRQGKTLERAGFPGSPPEAADALFDALLANKSATVFSVDDWDESLARVHTPTGRIQLAIPELFPELDALASEPAPGASAEFPFVLSAGERRSFTANTIMRNPEWRRKDEDGTLRMNPKDAKRLGLVDGGRARISTKRGSAEVALEISDRMQPGHVSLPNGLGLDFPDLGTTGVALNELTASEDRDWLAGTPWHKYTPARVVAV
jgi:anaerobic selenocysteine-containing dehydrogenase